MHTAWELGEDLEQYEQKVPGQVWEQPLQQLYHFAWGLRMKAKSVGEVPPERLAEYVEEYDQQVRELLSGEEGMDAEGS